MFLEQNTCEIFCRRFFITCVLLLFCRYVWISSHQHVMQTYIFRILNVLSHIADAFGFQRQLLPEGENIITTSRSHSNRAVTEAVEACEPSSVVRVGGAGHKVWLHSYLERALIKCFYASCFIICCRII